jgi:phosphatidylinositol glycan class T
MSRRDWLPWRMLISLVVALCLASIVRASNNSFDEHLTLRPLADGRLHTVFSFDLESSQWQEESIPIFSTVPRTLIHLAKASNAEEIHLSINAGRWDYRKWGRPEEEEMVGTGAEVWARLRNDGQSHNDVVLK